MGWLSFGAKKDETSTSSIPTSSTTTAIPPSSGTNFQQRSHTALPTNASESVPDTARLASPGGSDIEATLHQIAPDHADIRIKTAKITSNSTRIDPNDGTRTTDIRSTVEDFVSRYPPNNVFIIDGEKGVRQSIICTENNSGGGKTCLKLGVATVELFKTMQGMEYFCGLPNDVRATYFECRKIR